jgi:hypothetical protein
MSKTTTCETCGAPKAMRFLSPRLGRFVHLCAKCFSEANR